MNNQQRMESSDSVIQVVNLTKRYGQFTALDGISFTVHPGEIFGFLGPNGAGKTTALEIIEGIRTADSGDVRLLGLDIKRDRKKIQQRIGVQLQATNFFPELTVYETITFYCSLFPNARHPQEILEEVALTEKARAFPGNLSGGQRQRLALGVSLVNDPAILFLDEPTTGLDPQSRHMLWNTIISLRQRGKTIILTTHFMDEAQELSDRVAILDHGEIIAMDTPANLIASLGAQNTIECGIQGAQAQQVFAEKQLKHLPGFAGVQNTSERTLVFTTRVEDTIGPLLQTIRNAGAKLDYIQIHAPTLEDVFLQLTGRKLRD